MKWTRTHLIMIPAFLLAFSTSFVFAGVVFEVETTYHSGSPSVNGKRYVVVDDSEAGNVQGRRLEKGEIQKVIDEINDAINEKTTAKKVINKELQTAKGQMRTDKKGEQTRLTKQIAELNRLAQKFRAAPAAQAH